MLTKNHVNICEQNSTTHEKYEIQEKHIPPSADNDEILKYRIYSGHLASIQMTRPLEKL